MRLALGVAMTEAPTIEKVDPETLVLRARPRRVVRFKRNVLIGAAAIGSIGIAGLTWLGLKGPVLHATDSKVVYNPEKAADAQKTTPEQLQALPKTYADLPAGVPVLGPPLPGDLGKPIMEHAQSQGTVAPGPQMVSTGSNAGTGQVAGLFFQVSDRSVAASPTFASLAEAGLTGAGLIKPEVSTGRDSDLGGQGRKIAFASARSNASIYNAHTLETPASPYQVMAGTVISANLVTGLNSDLPGTVIAQVSSDVFDTVTGTIRLIPQGTRLIGEYDSVVSFGQSRALLIWKRLVMPDGSSLEVDNLPASDTEGYAGLSDRVDYHTFSLLKGVGLSTLLGVAALGGSGDDSDLVRALRESTRDTANQAGQRIVDRSLNIQPTLKVRPGWPLRVIVHKDLILKPYGT
jgi:type IV secretion system protein VirB10